MSSSVTVPTRSRCAVRPGRSDEPRPFALQTRSESSPDPMQLDSISGTMTGSIPHDSLRVRGSCVRTKSV